MPTKREINWNKSERDYETYSRTSRCCAKKGKISLRVRLAISTWRAHISIFGKENVAGPRLPFSNLYQFGTFTSTAQIRPNDSALLLLLFTHFDYSDPRESTPGRFASSQLSTSASSNASRRSNYSRRDWPNVCLQTVSSLTPKLSSIRSDATMQLPCGVGSRSELFLFLFSISTDSFRKDCFESVVIYFGLFSKSFSLHVKKPIVVHPNPKKRVNNCQLPLHIPEPYKIWVPDCHFVPRNPISQLPEYQSRSFSHSSVPLPPSSNQLQSNSSPPLTPSTISWWSTNRNSNHQDIHSEDLEEHDAERHKPDTAGHNPVVLDSLQKPEDKEPHRVDTTGSSLRTGYGRHFHPPGTGD